MDEMEKALKYELANTNSFFGLGAIIYHYGRVCNDQDEFKKVLNNVKDSFLNILKNIDVYLDALNKENMDDDREEYNEINNESEEGRNNTINGYGSISVCRDDDTINITLKNNK